MLKIIAIVILSVIIEMTRGKPLAINKPNVVIIMADDLVGLLQ